MNPSTGQPHPPRRPRRTGSTALLSLLAALCSAQALAQTRWVVVNGQRWSDAQVARMDRLQCATVPDGAYWLNERTGAWGYAGNPAVQGIVGDGCDGAQRAGDGTHGPYPTMRRANEVAQNFRRQGRSAAAFHNGDGYYVRVGP